MKKKTILFILGLLLLSGKCTDNNLCKDCNCYDKESVLNLTDKKAMEFYNHISSKKEKVDWNTQINRDVFDTVDYFKIRYYLKNYYGGDYYIIINKRDCKYTYSLGL